MSPSFSRFLLTVAVLCIVSFINPVAVSARQADDTAATPADTTAVEQEKWLSLDALVSAIHAKRDELADLRRQLAASVDEGDSERLKKDINQVVLDLESLQTAWEMLATGGADLSLFGVKVDKAFNWRAELQSVFEPLLVELKRLTERPRKIEQLRNDQTYYQRRLDVAEEALQSITAYRDNAPTGSLKSAFGDLESRWRKRRDELTNRLRTINLELQELFAGDGRAQRDSAQALKELLSGRVLNLLIGIAVMVLVYLLLRGTANLYNRHIVRASRRRSMVMRIGNLLLYLLTTLLVLVAGMSVFYLRGDWVLLGLFLILLIGAAWALQKSLPRYLQEAKLMLNLGPVREGERLVYRDLPWLVKSLGFYCSLVNPALAGGALQLPLRELVGYHSREFTDNEPWFPTMQGDFVTLENGNYGCVMAQTPEQVQLLVLGAVKTFPAATFLDQNPRNLSQQGFTLVISFGLDYRHQSAITTTIRDTLENELSAAMQQSEFATGLNSLAVEFSQAGASSLDLAVIASFSGGAADRYFRIQRLLQSLAVEACNRHDWVIPFNQITVHQALAGEE